MTISDLKASFQVMPVQTRKLILKAFTENLGNARRTADEFQCSYHTLWRIINDDGELRKKVEAIRRELSEQGIKQHGWSPKSAS